MKIEISDKILEDNEISIPETLCLLSYYFKVNTKTLETLYKKGFISKSFSNNQHVGFFLNPTGTDLISNMILDSALTQENIDQIDELADKMRELFPEGKKEGTPYYWRDSKKVIVMRLKSFFKKNGTVDNDKVLKATQNYVNSHINDRTNMRLLKYFIWKQIGDGEEVSDLASYLENLDAVDAKKDWTSGII